MSEAAKQEEAKPSRSLVRKLAEVKGAVDRIAKNGHNDHFNYDFATESDIAAAVRKEMADRHLVMFPNVTKTEWEKVPRKSGETKLCTLTVEFTVEDGDSGETRKFTILGQGEDSMDKATYKAMTGAEKYALLKLFMIPTGDDPEKDSEHRHTPGRQPPRQPEGQRDAQRAAPPPPEGEDMVVPFGKSKGKRLSEVTDSDLAWLLSAFAKSVAANDKTYHEKNVAQLKAAQAEAARRKSASGKVTAPPEESPRQLRMDEPADEGQEIVTTGQRLFRLRTKYGLTVAKFASLCKGATSGKEGGYTHEDLDRIEASLATMANALGVVR